MRVYKNFLACVYFLLVPDKPQQLSIGEPNQVTHFNRKRWKYVITWQVSFSNYSLYMAECLLMNIECVEKLSILIEFYQGIKRIIQLYYMLLAQ